MAFGILGFLLLMNIISTKFGGVIQTIATIVKLIPIIAIMGFGAAILGTLWAYDGWIGVTNMAGELKDPGKSLPKAISIGIVFVIGVYAIGFDATDDALATVEKNLPVEVALIKK